MIKKVVGEENKEERPKDPKKMIAEGYLEAAKVLLQKISSAGKESIAILGEENVKMIHKIIDSLNATRGKLGFSIAGDILYKRLMNVVPEEELLNILKKRGQL